MESNEVQWSATSCNNRAKRIVLSTKRYWLSEMKVVHNFFCKKITNSQTLSQTPLYS